MLDLRKVKILQAIVDDYVETTKPVGSDRLIEQYHFECKSATMRNEMAELAEMGYLIQPHTSAGRIPSSLGYRYYVDRLMSHKKSLTPVEKKFADSLKREVESEVENILQQTSRILSELTTCASVVTDMDLDGVTLRRTHLVEADSRHVLLVLLFASGQVEHRLLEVDKVPSPSALQALSNFMDSIVAEVNLGSIPASMMRVQIPSELSHYKALLSRIFDHLTQTASQISERRVFVEGTGRMLQHPEFKDVQRLENLLNALEQRSLLCQMLSQAMESYGEATVIIGEENVWNQMQDCSIVTTSYYIGERRAGFIGVIGPTRMRYDRAVASVRLMANSLSTVLTNLSLA